MMKTKVKNFEAHVLAPVCEGKGVVGRCVKHVAVKDSFVFVLVSTIPRNLVHVDSSAESHREPSKFLLEFGCCFSCCCLCTLPIEQQRDALSYCRCLYCVAQACSYSVTSFALLVVKISHSVSSAKEYPLTSGAKNTCTCIPNHVHCALEYGPIQSLLTV